MTKDKAGTGFGAKAITYIQEKNLERKLGRSLEVEKHTRPMTWGLYLEHRVHGMLSISYEYVSQKTLVHPGIDLWVGSPDNVNIDESVVGDTKCWEPKAFAEYVDCLSLNDIELFKKEYPKEFWQLISNACILGMKYIEPIVYMPYESEIPDIRESVSNYDCEDPWNYRFIAEAPISELAYLPDGGYYKNLNIFRFPVPEADKQALTDGVIEAGKLLIERPKILV
jgi:hypothetical protein